MPASTTAPRRLSKESPEEVKARGARVDHPGAPLAANVGEARGCDVADDAAAVPRLEAGALHKSQYRLPDALELRVITLEAEAGPVVVLDDQPSAGAQRGDQAVEDLPTLG